MIITNSRWSIQRLSSWANKRGGATKLMTMMILMKITIMTMKTNTITMVIEKKQDTASFTKGFLDRMSGPLVQVNTIETLSHSYLIYQKYDKHIVIVTISNQYRVTLTDQTIHMDFRAIVKTTAWARQCARKTMSTGKSNNLASLSTKGGPFSFRAGIA